MKSKVKLERWLLRHKIQQKMMQLRQVRPVLMLQRILERTRILDLFSSPVRVLETALCHATCLESVTHTDSPLYIHACMLLCLLSLLVFSLGSFVRCTPAKFSCVERYF